MKKRAVCAGHICIDITPAFQGKKKREISDLFVPGSLVAMDQAKVSLGGTVANTGIGMRLLGAEVSLMGMIGEDAFGRIILDEMERYGAPTESMIVRKGEGTSYSVILPPPGIDRIILHHTGCNDAFDCSCLDLDRLRGVNLFHFGYPPLMKRMYEENGAELIRLLRTVRECGCAISLDMAMFEEHTPAGQQDWRRILKEAMPYVDFFVPSVEELCIMLDRERYHAWKERAKGGDITEVLDLERDVRPLADELLSFGARVVLIKCGIQGLYFRTAGEAVLEAIPGGIGDSIAKSWADQEMIEACYKVEHVASGIGAGDTTIAAFLTGVLEGRDPVTALHLAAATGALCVTTYDSLSGIPSLAEVEAKVSAGWKKRGE